MIQAQSLTANGQLIVNDQGEEVLLKGMGLGGWMLQEGYMLQTGAFAGAQYQIRASIEELVGEEKTDTFYEGWYQNHCTEADIDSLKSWGFNSVRLPMHYNLFTLPIEEEPVSGEQTWLEKGFVMTDSLLSWCAKREMYLILDLHAAPGGQGNDANISDYDPSKPSLWESTANQDKTVALWSQLAERYKGEAWIGGYDLINEPNWNFTNGANENGCDESTNTPLKQLYVRITEAIRQTGDNHLIFIEGNCWANNHNGIWPPWETNLVLSFHKYWTNNDQSSIQGFLDLRNQYNIPLWMGEAGENSNTWFRNAVALLEENNIGWAWWPLKKVGSVVNPMTITKNEDYDNLLNYWENGGSRPSVEEATNALDQLVENLKIQNNVYRPDVVDALIRQQASTITKPYKEHHLPGVLSATDFDLGRNGFAYFDTDTANYRVSTGEYTEWNRGWSYRNDGVDIEPTSDDDSNANGYNIGWTNDGEWLQYEVIVDSTAVYGVLMRYASNGNTQVSIEINGADKTATLDVPSSGGYQSWQHFAIPELVLYEGTNVIRLHIRQGGANLSFLNFVLEKKVSDVPIEPASASTNSEGTIVRLNLNKRLNANVVPESNDFDLTVDGESMVINSVYINTMDASQIFFEVGVSFDDKAIITLSYSGNTLQSEDGSTLLPIDKLNVENRRPFYFRLPAKIEAEDFYVNQGLELETTTDTGGGQNIGFTDARDYLDYRLSVEEEGIFDVQVRVASESSNGKISLQQLNDIGEVVNEVQIEVPNTNGWQTWQTITASMKLDAMIGSLRMKVVSPQFNINWYRFTVSSPSPSLSVKTSSEIQVFPNPVTDGQLYISRLNASASTLTIYSLGGRQVLRKELKEASQVVNVELLSEGMYIWEIGTGANATRGRVLVK